MRIVAGQYRGKKLFSPNTDNIRPTSERAREAIFNILNSRLGSDYSKIHLLDVFAGTGAFGYEGLSRGMASVTFVDKDVKPAQKNAKLFSKEREKISFVTADASKLPKARKKYDLVFCDAPYAKGLSEKALSGLAAGDWLADGAICIVETKNNEQFALPENFALIDERIYGLAKISFLRYK